MEHWCNVTLSSYLSAYIRQANNQGIVPTLDRSNWRNFARAHQTTRVPQKLTMLLELVANRSSRPGDEIPIDCDLDYPLLDAGSAEEVLFLLQSLERRGDLSTLQWEQVGDDVGSSRCSMSASGWQRLEPPAGSGGIPGRCFIAMSFDPSLNDAYELGIQLAVKACGFDPIRIDRVHHNEKICDKILAEIRLAQFVVADFTGHRAGVYFEAGYAMALGRPVIWTCHELDLDKTHFDTRQYNHIVWSTPDDLKAKLTDRIRATILK